MKKLKEIALAINLHPKLQLGEKLPKGGVKPTGPHTVKFLEEPMVVIINKEGKSVKAMRFIVEENGQKFRWVVPVLNKEGQPNYLIERLMNVEVGDTRILEMKKQGARNYIDVSIPGEERVDDEPEDEEEVPDEETERSLNG